MAKKGNRFLRSIVRRFLTWEYFLCLFLSFLFWLLIKLSDNYQSSMTLQAVYLNQPTYKVLTDDPVKEFTVSVETTGWNLLTGSLRNKSETVRIDLSPYSGDRVSISTESLLDRISESLSQDYRLLSVYPSSVNLNYEELVYKTVPVEAMIDFSTKAGFGELGPMTIKPDSVLLSGSESALANIHSWPTVQKSITGIDKDIDLSLPLKKPEKSGLKINLESVNVFQGIDEWVTTDLLIAIRATGVPDGYRVALIPEEVKVFFDHFAEHSSIIDVDDFVVTADFSTLGGEDDFVELNIDSASAHAYNLLLETAEVSFIFYEE